MIRVTEYLLIRFQDRFGIPKWRVLVTAWCLFAATGVVRALLYDFMIVNSVLLATWVIAAWCCASESLKAEQREADRALMIVPNETRNSRKWACLRYAALVCLMLDFAPPIRALDPTRDVLLVIGACLASCNTFPMVGPTFRERLKNLFTVKRTELAKEVSA